MRLLLLVLLAGCGRFAFESTPDASEGPDAKPCTPIGHDEDRDAIDDACDVCPHLPDAQQPDGDGDGVGDACDPNPTVARDRILFFDPYTSMRSEWEYNAGTVTIANDQLNADARGGVLTGALKPRSATEDVYVIGGRIGAGGTSGQRQLTVVLGGPSGYYYCEIYGDATPAAFFNATYTPDDVNFFVASGSDAVGPVENRAFRLELRGSPTTYGCATTWPATMQSLSTSRPPINIEHFNYALKDVDATLDYFIQIHSD